MQQACVLVLAPPREASSSLPLSSRNGTVSNIEASIFFPPGAVGGSVGVCRVCFYVFRGTTAVRLALCRFSMM